MAFDKAAWQREWQAKNPEKMREYGRRYYHKHRDAELVGNRKRHAWAKARLAVLKSGPCTDCGDHFPPCVMNFDHVRGEKRDPIGAMYAMATHVLMREIAKCDLVCSNCHRIRTFKRKETINGLLV